jgi:hypothetical protein
VEDKRVRVKWEKSTDGVRGESWISELGCIFKIDGWPGDA